MGGRGSGGRRVGSGRKGKLAMVVRHPSAAAIASLDTVDPPADWQAAPAQLLTLTSQLAFLAAVPGPDEPNPQIAELEARVQVLQETADALTVWHELAPHAVAQRTLIPATAAHFAMLCRAMVQERSTNVPDGDHRGVMHRVSTWLKDFRLAPFGKPMVDAPAVAPAVSKWAGALK